MFLRTIGSLLGLGGSVGGAARGALGLAGPVGGAAGGALGATGMGGAVGAALGFGGGGRSSGAVRPDGSQMPVEGDDARRGQMFEEGSLEKLPGGEGPMKVYGPDGVSGSMPMPGAVPLEPGQINASGWGDGGLIRPQVQDRWGRSPGHPSYGVPPQAWRGGTIGGLANGADKFGSAYQTPLR